MLGIDEAGRGPLAGPVAVGVVMAPEKFVITRAFPGLADSKQLSEGAREEVYKELRARKAAGEIEFCVRFSSADVIDSRGIARAVRGAISRGVRSLAPSADGVRLYLDGSLIAPEEYAQQTIIGGDEALPIIALASIVAKVRRDRLMRRMALLYPGYGFEEHMGYGTAFHYKMLKKHGLSPIHRSSYIHIAK